MIRLIAAAFICASLACAQQYIRPTSDDDAGSEIAAQCSTTASYVTSPGMDAVYTDKTGAGPIGGGNTLSVTAGTSTAKSTARLFTGFSDGTGSIQSVTLYLSGSCTNDIASSDGSCSLAYSIAPSGDWLCFATISPDGALHTLSQSFDATSDLTSLDVAAIAAASGGSTTSFNVEDIWIEVVTTSGKRRIIIIQQ